MPELKDFVGTWKFRFVHPPEATSLYPPKAELTIVPSPDVDQAVDIEWKDKNGAPQGFEAVPFQGCPSPTDWCGRLFRQDEDGTTITISFVDKGKLVGVVDHPDAGITPVSGTWGADSGGDE